MSARDDRIPVPSNGHRPPLAAAKAAASASSVSTAPATPVAPAATPVAPAPTPAASASDDDDLREPPRIIVTPGQATAVGFGIIAGLILVLLGRRRGRR